MTVDLFSRTILEVLLVANTSFSIDDVFLSHILYNKKKLYFRFTDFRLYIQCHAYISVMSSGDVINMQSVLKTMQFWTFPANECCWRHIFVDTIQRIVVYYFTV